MDKCTRMICDLVGFFLHYIYYSMYIVFKNVSANMQIQLSKQQVDGISYFVSSCYQAQLRFTWTLFLKQIVHHTYLSTLPTAYTFDCMLYAIRQVVGKQFINVFKPASSSFFPTRCFRAPRAHPIRMRQKKLHFYNESLLITIIT